MGKVNNDKVKCDKKSKMSDILLTERRKNTDPIGNNLKRSKSVRASLKQIGNKFLLQKQNGGDLSKRSPSLTNLSKKKCGNLEKMEFIFERGPVETILKTPMICNNKTFKNQLAILGFNREYLGKRKDNLEENLILSKPPSKVAPKAAAILEIPIKENCEPLHFKSEKFKEMRGNKQGGADKLQEKGVGFNRNSLRLSITMKKKSSNWNSFSTSSRFNILFFIP